MSIWTDNVDTILRRTGDLWTTTVDNECVNVYGVFEAQNQLQADATGHQVLLVGSSLTISSKIAQTFVTNQKVVDPSNNIWYVREILQVDDGSVSRCSLVEKL